MVQGMASPNALRIIYSLQVLGAYLRLLLTASWVFADDLLLRLLVLHLTSYSSYHLLDIHLLHAAFSYHLPVYVYCNCFAYYLLALNVKPSYALLIDLDVRVFLTVWCLLLYSISSAIWALCLTYYILVTATTYSSAHYLLVYVYYMLITCTLVIVYWLNLHFNCLLGLYSLIYLFLTGKPCLLTLHVCTAYFLLHITY